MDEYTAQEYMNTSEQLTEFKVLCYHIQYYFGTSAIGRQAENFQMIRITQRLQLELGVPEEIIRLFVQ